MKVKPFLNEEVDYLSFQKTRRNGKEISVFIKKLENNWNELKMFFKFSPEVRRIIYTKNVIENLNRFFRKVTKIRNSFQIDEDIIFMYNKFNRRI